MWNCSRNENWQGKPKYVETVSPSAISCTTNQTWPDLGVKYGLSRWGTGDYRPQKVVPLLRLSFSGVPTRRSAFGLRSGSVGFAIGKVALGQVSSNYLGFPGQLSFYQLPHTHISCHLGCYKKNLIIVEVSSGLKSHPTMRKKRSPELRHSWI
jgi:hypothetical protein